METQRLPLASVIPNPNQPRKFFDPARLEELAASIRENGLMQPIKVRPVGDQVWMIVAGERRWRAHCLLADRGQLPGNVVPAIVEEMDEQRMAIEAIIENLQRADIKPLEEAKAFGAMLQRGYDAPGLARKLGVPTFRVEERLGLLRLDEQLQKLIETGAIAATAGFEISKLPSHEQTRIAKAIAGGKLPTITEIRAAVNAILDKLSQNDFFGETNKASDEEVATVNRMEAKITQIAGMVAAGWKDGECIVARKVSPDRAGLMADQLTAIRKHVAQMERELRIVSAQADIITEDVAA